MPLKIVFLRPQNWSRLLLKLYYRSIQDYYPRKIIISELIRRGVIYYTGNFLPQIIFAEVIMRGNSVSHYVDRLFWG